MPIRGLSDPPLVFSLLFCRLKSKDLDTQIAHGVYTSLHALNSLKAKHGPYSDATL